MLSLVISTKFRRDYRRIKKRGYDTRKIAEVIKMLLAKKTLPARMKDHALTGDYQGYRECHILPDWLLIYTVDNDELVLIAFRTGTHADLFDE